MNSRIHKTPTNKKKKQLLQTQAERTASNTPGVSPRGQYTPDYIISMQGLIGNQAVQRLMKQHMLQREMDGQQKVESKTFYMGMNPLASKEARNLKGVMGNDVITSLNDPKVEEALADEPGLIDWIATHLPDTLSDLDTFLRILDFLQSIDPTARDQMSAFIKTMYQADRGDYKLERLVLSGHSNGVELWGDDEGEHEAGGFILDTTLKELVAIFPDAAAQVEDVMFSACFSSFAITLVADVFPNLQTAWGYAKYSPAAGLGAEQHVSLWEYVTRDDGKLNEKHGMGSSALWTRDKGFIRNDPADVPVDEIYATLEVFDEDAQKMYAGTMDLEGGFLRSYYTFLQTAINHPKIKEDKEQSAKLQIKRDWTLRLRFYDKISTRFMQTYGDNVRQAYAGVGLNAPDFSKMKRTELPREIERFREASSSETAESGASELFEQYVYQGLFKLDNELIPTRWA